MLVAIAPFIGGAAAPSCMLCSEDETAKNQAERAGKPLKISVTSKLNFSRLALTGQGSAQVAVDPESGMRNINGEIIGLGGYPAAAEVLLIGEAGRNVRIDLPSKISMHSSTGGAISIVDIRTTLGPSPKLDSNGQLKFSFGGRLQLSGNIAGTFRGRIPITANYE